MTDMINIGNRLCEIRKEKGLTLKRVAKELGIYHTTLHHYEKGERQIPQCKLEQLCELYGVDKEDLMKKEVVEAKEKDYLSLQKAVDALEGNPVIHIGSKTGFFFIGTKEEYEANIDFVQQDLQATRMEHLSEYLRQLDLYKGKIIHPDGDPGTEKYWQLLSDRAKRLSWIAQYIQKLENYLNTFVAIRKREVVEQYDRIQKDGVVIIVEGKENGEYWSYDEYKEGIAAEDLEGEEE